MSLTTIPLEQASPAAFARLVFGLTPTARINTSNESSSLFVNFTLFSLNSSALQPKWNLMPFSSSSF